MTVLYRAVATEHVDDAFTGDVIAWPGAILGRQSGYLSRSGAKDAGVRSGVAFEIVKSEPVVFLSEAEKLVAQIRSLNVELDRVRSLTAFLEAVNPGSDSVEGVPDGVELATESAPVSGAVVGGEVCVCCRGRVTQQTNVFSQAHDVSVLTEAVARSVRGVS